MTTESNGWAQSGLEFENGGANDKFHLRRVNLMALYNTGSQERLIEVLTEIRTYHTFSKTELRDLTDGTLDKLAGMTDAEFDARELYTDLNL